MAGISGDLYDFFVKNGKLVGVGLFDISGHGISSGLLTMLARSVIFHRFMEKKDERLNRVIEEINSKLIEDIGNLDHYITGILLSFHDSSVEYVNAGHPDLIMKKAKTNSSQIVQPKNKSFKGHFLGIDSMQESFNVLRINVDRGDVLLMYTDCLNENMNTQGEPFGYKRIMAAMDDMPAGAAAGDILRHLMEEFYNFISDSTISDDLTLIVMKKK